jgi:benzoate/toluate 1,2-dioxygenase subunit beta
VTAAAVPATALTDAEALLYLEAQLLDERDFEGWLALYTEDAIYWLPDRADADPRKSSSIAYDDRKRMEDRVWRLMSGNAHAQIPFSQTVHLITNVRLGEPVRDTLIVHSNLLVLHARKEVQQSTGGRVEHHLRPVDGRLKIARKNVILVNRFQTQYNLTFIV